MKDNCANNVLLLVGLCDVHLCLVITWRMMNFYDLWLTKMSGTLLSLKYFCVIAPTFLPASGATASRACISILVHILSVCYAFCLCYTLIHMPYVSCIIFNAIQQFLWFFQWLQCEICISLLQEKQISSACWVYESQTDNPRNVINKCNEMLDDDDDYDFDWW